MRLRNRHFKSPEIPTVPNHVKDPREDVTETLSCRVAGDPEVEAVLSEADDRSRSSAAAAINSAVTDNLAKSKSSSLISEHDNVKSAPSPSTIPSESSNRSSGSDMEVFKASIKLQSKMTSLLKKNRFFNLFKRYLDLLFSSKRMLLEVIHYIR